MIARGWTHPPTVEGDDDELFFGDHSGERSKELLSKLELLRFNYFQRPQRPLPTLTLGEAVICTPGNLSNIQAPAKAGKSRNASVISAWL